MPDNTKRVLIFRTGSLGDTVVALPCFHLIARAFPEAERRLLTSVPIHPKAVAPSTILENTGLVHGCLNYDPKNWDLSQALRLRAAIRDWHPDVLIYLAEPRGLFGTWRDVIFFKSCGIPTLIGVPSTKDLRENRWIAEKKCFEQESERLARCLKVLGDARLDERSSWELSLTREEEAAAVQCLDAWEDRKDFFVSNVTAKVSAKDWGEENWSNLLDQLSQRYPKLGLVLIGADTDAAYSRRVAERWKGPLLNLCGRLTLRQTAALMKRAAFYLGHDSGPMHLAAALGIRCIALFLATEKPGVWFPYGDGHCVIDHEHGRENAMGITVDEVLEAVHV